MTACGGSDVPKLMVARDLVKGHPASPAAYLAVAVARAKKAGRQVVDDDRALIAYVNHGRWVADCPHCNGGIMLDPTWPLAACLGAGCHRVFRAIAQPAEWAQIEEILAVRPVPHQHWGYERGVARSLTAPVQSIADLHRENAEHRDEIAHGRGGRR